MSRLLDFLFIHSLFDDASSNVSCTQTMADLFVKASNVSKLLYNIGTGAEQYNQTDWEATMHEKSLLSIPGTFWPMHISKVSIRKQNHQNKEELTCLNLIRISGLNVFNEIMHLLHVSCFHFAKSTDLQNWSMNSGQCFILGNEPSTLLHRPQFHSLRRNEYAPTPDQLSSERLDATTSARAVWMSLLW